MFFSLYELFIVIDFFVRTSESLFCEVVENIWLPRSPYFLGTSLLVILISLKVFILVFISILIKNKC